MRLGINAFFGLMFTVLGVIYQPIIEKPLEIYYGADVTHTATDYSYKPGQQGTTYEFYLAREDRGFTPIGMFQSVGIPALFYLAVFTLIGLVRRLVKKPRPFDENHPYFSKMQNPDARAKILRFQEKQMSTSKRFTQPLIIVMAIGIFFLCGRYHVFGLGNPTGNDAVEEESISMESFAPTHLVYTPNGKGTGDVWLIEEDRNADGAFFIEDGTTSSFDSIIYTIRIYNQEIRESKALSSFVVSNEMSVFDPFYANDKVWLTARPNMLRAFSGKDGKRVYEDIDEFSKKFRALNSGVHNWYRTSKTSSEIRIETLDGGLFYYQFETDSISEKSFEWGRKNEIFALKRGNGDRFHLETNRKKNEDKFYINGEIIFQDDRNCLIHHFKTIADDSPEMITCFDADGKEIWTVNSPEFPQREPGEFEMNVNIMQFPTLRDGEYFVISFNNEWMSTTNGIMAIHATSGKIKWKLDYADIST